MSEWFRIRPEPGELQKIRSEVEKAVAGFRYQAESGIEELLIGFQSIEEPAVHFSSPDGNLELVLNPDTWDEGQALRDAVLRGLLELDYYSKRGGPELPWQELKLMAYVEARRAEVTGEKLEEESQEAGKLLEQLLNGEIDEDTYQKMGGAARHLASVHGPTQILEMGKTAILENLEEAAGT